MGKLDLPFKVGEQIESKSFDPGYRGAWFRCTIKGLKKIKGSWNYLLEYLDFPDEELIPEQVYQKPSADSKSKKQLMMRPAFPPLHRESQMPDPITISDVVVIVDDVWKVGDLVDWFTTDCYWSGTITKILENQMVQIDLPPPPAGEGSSYKASSEDLRPSLDWCEELGWAVPQPMDKENHRCCARLIRPMNTGRKDIQATTGDSLSLFSCASAGSLPCQERSKEMGKRPRSITDSKEKEKNVDLEVVYSGIGKTGFFDSAPMAKRSRSMTESKKEKADRSVDSIVEMDIGKTTCSNSVSSSFIGDGSGEMVGSVVEKEQCLKKTEISGAGAGAEKEQCSLQSFKDKEHIVLNSMYSDSLEAAIMDLEELANRVKWLKGILHFGMPLSTTVQPKPIWKFLEHRGSSTPR